MQALKDIIAANIVLLRRDANMTQLELAEKLNYSDKAVSKWERGESIPDITVLKQIADLFQVSLDFLVQAEHPVKHEAKQTLRQRIRNHGFITGICVLLVWLIATLVFVVLDISIKNITAHWLCFIYAVPVSMIVWLVFNSIWFKPHRNFLIVSLLVVDPDRAVFDVLVVLHEPVAAVFPGDPGAVYYSDVVSGAPSREEFGGAVRIGGHTRRKSLIPRIIH